MQVRILSGVLSQYRKELGLAASILDHGWVIDVGFFEQNQELLELLKIVSFKGIPVQHMFDAMMAAVRPHTPKKVNSSNWTFVAEGVLLLGIGGAMSLSNLNSRAVWKDH